MLLTAVAAACSGDGSGTPVTPSGGRPGPTPTPALPVIAVNDTVTREIKTATQSDTLRFVATGPLRVRVDLQHTVTTPTTTVALRYTLLDSATRTTVVSGLAVGAAGVLGPDLADPTVAWSRLPAAGTYLVVVSPQSTASLPAYVGGYRLRLVGSDPRPETARPTLVAGDSIVESIDRPGDVDEYLLTLDGGSRDFVLALRAEGASETDTVLVEQMTGYQTQVTGRDALSLPLVTSAGDAPYATPTALGALDQRYDTLRVRVRATRAATTGRYRLTFKKVDRGPEHASRQVVAGDTVVDAIDDARDIDEYTFVGDPSREYAVALQGTSGSAADTVALEMDYPISLRSRGTAATLLSTISGRFVGKAYTIRVTGVNDVVRRGGYRFVVVPIDPRPERAPATLAVGDTVADRIDIAPDVDEYEVAARPGDYVVVYAQALTADTLAQLSLLADTGRPDLDYPYGVSGGTSALRGWRTEQLPVPASGKIRLRVSGMRTFTGAYRLAAVRINPEPETTPARVALGQVAGEALDPPGDIDEFTVDVPDGQEFALYGAAPAPIWFVLHYPNGAPGMAEGPGPQLLSGHSTLLRGAGTYRVQVVGLPVQTYTHAQSAAAVPYQFVLYPMKRAPERAPAILRVGDVVSEAIDHSVDIDEFHVQARAGTRFRVCAQSLASPATSQGWVFAFVSGAELVPDPGTPNQTLSSTTMGYLTVGAVACTTTLAMPASGDALLTVHGSQSSIAPYRLEVRAVP